MPNTFIVPIKFDCPDDLKEFIKKAIRNLSEGERGKLHEQLVIAEDGDTYLFQDIVAELKKTSPELPDISFPLTNGEALRLHDVTKHHDIKKDLLVFNRSLGDSLDTLIKKKILKQKLVTLTGLQTDIAKCPISKEQTFDPVVTIPHSQHYDYGALLKWLNEGLNKDPLGAGSLTVNQVLQNHAMASFVRLHHFIALDVLKNFKAKNKDADSLAAANECARKVLDRLDSMTIFLSHELELARESKIDLAKFKLQYPGKSSEEMLSLFDEKLKKLDRSLLVCQGAGLSAVGGTFLAVVSFLVSVVLIETVAIKPGGIALADLAANIAVLVLIPYLLVRLLYSEVKKHSAFVAQERSPLLSAQFALNKYWGFGSNATCESRESEIKLALNDIEKIRTLAPDFSNKSDPHSVIVDIDEPEAVPNEASPLVTPVSSIGVVTSGFFAKSTKSITKTCCSTTYLKAILVANFFSILTVYFPWKIKIADEYGRKTAQYIADKADCSRGNSAIIFSSCKESVIGSQDYQSYFNCQEDGGYHTSGVERNITNAAREICGAYPLKDVFLEPVFLTLLVGNILLLLYTAQALYKNYTHQKPVMKIEEVEESIQEPSNPKP